jgi:hypothetical protein
MPHALADADSFAAAVTVPDDTDAASAASVGLPFQNLADRSRYLKNRALGARGGVLPVNLASPLINSHHDYSAGVHFVCPCAGPLTPIHGCWTQTDVGNAGLLAYDITSELFAAGLEGAHVTAVTATIDGDLASATPPHAALPATMPIVRLRVLTVATAAIATAFTASDPTAVVATYDASHSFSAVGDVIVVQGFRYIVEFLGEAGGNAETGMTLVDLTATVTP